MNIMARNHYGTITALSWAIGHYFFGCKHFVFLAGEYYPYRLKNPKSSNPHLIYQDIYQPWRDRDDYDKTINQLRINLRNAVIKKLYEEVIDLKTADRLKRICDEVDITFLYPVVCRVDANQFDPKRFEVAGSGLEGSSEYLIRDLDELEINEILFLDFDADKDFKQIVTEEYYGYRQNREYYNDPKEVLDILERRCTKNGIQIPISVPQS